MIFLFFAMYTDCSTLLHSILGSSPLPSPPLPSSRLWSTLILVPRLFSGGVGKRAWERGCTLVCSVLKLDHGKSFPTLHIQYLSCLLNFLFFAKYNSLFYFPLLHPWFSSSLLYPTLPSLCSTTNILHIVTRPTLQYLASFLNSVFPFGLDH